MGTELLLGDVVDTNSCQIAKILNSLGVDLFRKISVGDNFLRIKNALKEALLRADIVIISGGLGPTEDDLTREAVSEALGKKLSVREDVFKRVKERLKHRNVPEKVILKQSLVPSSAEIIQNPVGTAPGIVIEEKGKIIILLPGVPRELKAMLPEVEKYLEKKVKSSSVIKSRILKVWGLTESQVNEKIAPLMTQENPTVALLAKEGEVHIRITAKFPPSEVEEKIKSVESIIREKIGDYIFGKDEDTLEKVVGNLLIEKNITLSLAESCSGGLVCHRLTNVPGISASLLAGVVSYSNRAKSEILKVPERLIKEKGAVSYEVALKMAEGVRKLTGSCVSLGITGIAGPTGGTPQKPVGLVYIALCAEEGKFCQRYIFPGEREMVKLRTSQATLDILRRYLLGRLELKE
ncbi:competence/damage-inducible protein A [Candidatus Aerophobetes bacterium]|nr:competence/damage-inducible protein A [Candidatus Aerophobetes bacterium]